MEAVDNIHLPVRPGDWQRQALVDDARSWLMRNEWSWPCSFVRICAALGLDPDYIRRGVARRDPLTPPRRDVYGNELPTGIFYDTTSVRRPYHTKTYHSGRQQHHAFATLPEAVAFRARWQATRIEKRAI